MSIHEQIFYLVFSSGISLGCYALGFLRGASAQRLGDYRRWRERKIRWREFEDS